MCRLMANVRVPIPVPAGFSRGGERSAISARMGFWPGDAMVAHCKTRHHPHIGLSLISALVVAAEPACLGIINKPGLHVPMIGQEIAQRSLLQEPEFDKSSRPFFTLLEL